MKLLSKIYNLIKMLSYVCVRVKLYSLIRIRVYLDGLAKPADPVVYPLKDKSGNTYTTVTIGSQECLVENFRSTKYANGSDIHNITDKTGFNFLGANEFVHFGAPTQQFDTLEVSGNDITSAISNGVHQAVCILTTETVSEKRIMELSFTITLNSGSLPYLYVQDADNAPLYNGQVTEGLNNITIDATDAFIDPGVDDQFSISLFSHEPTEIVPTPTAMDFSLTGFTCVYEGWTSDTQGAYCAYDNDTDNVADYGLLYNWPAVDNAKGLAYLERNGVQETGWRVVTKTDFDNLSTGLGGNSVSGGKLKESGVIHWTTPNVDADNSSGFTLLPGGFRSHLGVFSSINNIAFLATSTEYTVNTAYYYVRADYDSGALTAGGGIFKRYGTSVRLIRDI